MNLCELRNVALERKARDYTYRLRIESLAIRAGEKIALIGPSGCGKSTALDLLAMILPPSAAEKFLFNAPGDTPEDVAELWRRGGRERMARLRLRHIGYVLQTGGLLPFLSARDNMTTPGRAKGMDAKAVDAGLKELAGRLGIGHLLSALPDKLSIGERQRECALVVVSHDHRLVEENGFRCLRLDVDGGDGSINTTLRG